MDNYILLLAFSTIIIIITIFYLISYWRLKKGMLTLEDKLERQKEWFFQLSGRIGDYITDQVIETVIPQSLLAKLREAVSKDVVEQFAIYTQQFREANLNPQDCIHIGEPVDYLVFDGWKEGKIKRIVFVEVKSGEKATLKPVQLEIKKITENPNGRVEWVTLDFTGEKLVDLSRIKEIIKASEETVEIKKQISSKIKNEKLQEITEEFLKEKEEEEEEKEEQNEIE